MGDVTGDGLDDMFLWQGENSDAYIIQGNSAGTSHEPFVAIVWSVHGVHVADKVERIYR